MRRFLIKTLVYGLYGTLLIGVLWWMTTATRGRLLATEANVLVCGNSTIEYGLDDRQYPNILNMGLNAEHLEYVYAKIKMMKHYNQQIDTLIIGIDNAILFKGHTDTHPSDIHHPYYYDQYSASDIFDLIRYGSLDWNESYISRPFAPTKIVMPLLSLTGTDLRIQDLGIGGFDELWKRASDDAFNVDDVATDVSLDADDYDKAKIAIAFLHKINDYCAEHGITLIFVTPPYYKGAVNREYGILLKEEFPEVPHYDYVDLEMPDSCYADPMHLNAHGAKIFADRLINDLAPTTKK